MLSLSLSVIHPSNSPSLVPPNQQMVNDSWTGCTHAIVSEHYSVDVQQTGCLLRVVDGSTDMGLLKKDSHHL